MNASKVDVLAFFDGEIERRELFGAEHDIPALNLPGVVEARAARAAVAELIEVVRNSPCYCEDGEGGEADITCDRCRVLARIGGAA